MGKLRPRAAHAWLGGDLNPDFLTENSSELNPGEEHLPVWQNPLPCGCSLHFLFWAPQQYVTKLCGALR